MPILKHLLQHKLLLDTHILIWIVANENTKKFKKEFIDVVKNSDVHGTILISPISIWEIGMVVGKKKN